MAKARRVKGIRPRGPLRDNAQRILDTRLDEFMAWEPALHDAALIDDLHNMRIAAKRVRYALEMFEVCFDVGDILREVTAVQEDLGEIHDLDVLIGILRVRLHAGDEQTEQLASEIMGLELSAAEKSNSLRRMLYTQARDRTRLGLFGLLGDKVAERNRRYAAFQERWRHGGLEELRHRVRQVAELEPVATLEEGLTEPGTV
jgi:hypothetical protein